MSNYVQALVVTRQFGGVHRKIIAKRIADFADNEGRGIFPSKELLSDECEISTRSVQNILSEFVESGLLVLVDEGGRGQKSTRRYDMDLDVLLSMPLVPIHERRRREKEAKAAEVKGEPGAPLETAKGEPHDSLGRTGCSQTLIEPRTPLTPQGVTERTGPPYDGDGPTDRPETVSPFDEAFALWPGYLTEERGPAWDRWAQLAPEDRQRAKRYIRTFLDIWAKNQGRKRVYSFAKYLVEQPWIRARAAPGGAGKPVILKAFSVDWLLRRFELLLAGPGVDDWRDPRHWRDLKDFDSKSRHGFAGAPIGWTPPSVRMEPVPAGSEVFEAWRAAFKRADWLWLPDPGNLPVVHFPACGPPAVGITSEFVALLSGPADQVDAGEKSDA